MEFINLIVSLTVFLVLCFFCFLIPGVSLFRFFQIKFNFFENLVLGSVVGYIIFSLLIYLFQILNLGLLVIPIFIIFSLTSSFKIFHNFRFSNINFQIEKKYFFLVIILILGIIGQLLIIAPSGSLVNQNLLFWSALGHDGLWHVALIEEVKKGFPLQNPIFAGLKLVNYHFFSDLAPAIFSQFTNISSLDLFFRFFPLLFSFWLGTLTFILTLKLDKKFISGIWAVVFVYFSGSFGYIITLINDKKIGGEAKFWSTQIQSSSGNPPQLVSLCLVLTLVIFLIKFNQSKNWKSGLICILLASPLSVFKVYAAVVVIGALLVISVIEIIFKHKFSYAVITLPIILFSLALFLPNTSGSTGFLILEPWWFIRTMVVATDKLNWIDLELRRQTYLFHHSYLRVAQIEILAFFIFLIGNLGTKFIGFWQIKKMLLNFSDQKNQFIFLTILISFGLPMLFLQKGVAGNTIQFLQYFLLFMSILAGITVAQIITKLKNPFFTILFSLLILILSIPTQFGLIYDFYSKPAFAKVDKSELMALAYIKEHSPTSSIILSPPFDRFLNTTEATRNIWMWSDTSYIPALSSRRVFIADTEQLDILGYDFNKRQKIQNSIFAETNPDDFIKLLKNNKINFIYLTNLQIKPRIILENKSLKLFYKNSEVEVWQVI